MTTCSGTLIAPDLVLTAAHCFEKAIRSNPSTLSKFRVQTDSSRSGLHFSVAKITDAEIHPQFWGDHRGAMDFAWVRIDPPFTDIAPAELPLSRARLDSLLRAANKTEIVGYGLTSLRLPGPGEAPATGIKHKASAKIQFRTGAEFFAGDRNADSCTGDSGGAAFLKTDATAENPSGFVLAGVTSRGPMPCASDYESGAYGLVSEALCWLHTSAHYKEHDPDLAAWCDRELAANVPAADDITVMKENFMTACLSADLSLPARQDLEALFGLAGIYRERAPDSCESLRKFLTETTNLDVSHRNLRQTSWLRHATRLEKLLASDNLISSLAPLAELRYLRFVDVRNNQITDFSPLRNHASSPILIGVRSQAHNLSETAYSEIAKLGAAAGTAKRTLIIALRDMLAAGDIDRKSRDLALKRQLNISDRGLRSLAAINGLENLETLSVQFNPDITDWSDLLTLPSLRLLRYATSDKIPDETLSMLRANGVQCVAVD